MKSAIKKDVERLPIIGAAIRLIKSEPAPIDRLMGRSSVKSAATIMRFGRR